MAHRLLTPNEVRTATLHATWLRGGYDTDETDELLDDCAYTIQVLTEKIAVQAHGMLAAGENVGNADNVDRLKAMLTAKYDRTDEDGE